MVKMKWDNDAWVRGYNCLGPRSHNPYATDVLTEEGRQQYQDWDDGWHARFWGE